MHERLTYRFDDVLGLAIRDVEGLSRKVGAIDHEAIASARANPSLQKAVIMLDQAINNSRDHLIASGRIDPQNHRHNVAAVEDARKQITSLALALAVGLRIIDSTESAFHGVFEESERKRAVALEQARAAHEAREAERLRAESARPALAASGPVPAPHVAVEPEAPEEPTWDREREAVSIPSPVAGRNEPGPGPEQPTAFKGPGGVKPDQGSGPEASGHRPEGATADRVEPRTDPGRAPRLPFDRRGKGKS